MKILLLADKMEFGGAETHVATLARGLLQAGHTVGLCSYGGKIAETLAREGVQCRKLPEIGRNPLAFLAARRILAKEIRKNGYEILHAHTRMTSLLSRGICNPYMRKSAFLPVERSARGKNARRKQTGNPVRIVTAHARFRADGIFRLLSDWGDATVAVSEDLRAYVSDVYGLPAECVTVIPNGIDAARFHPLPGGAERGTHDGERGNPPVEILFVSRLEPDCSLGAELVLQAAAGLAKKDDLPPFRVTVAGQGSALPALAALAGRVNFLVGRPLVRAVRPSGEKDLIGLYRRSEIFVGVSRAAMEASFCGCAVLLCGNEGYGGLLSPERRELAAGNFTCRGLPLPTGRGLTRDLLFLLQNPAHRRANAEKTGEWMRQNFGAEGVCRAVEQVYRRRLWLAGKGDFPT